MLIHSMLKMEKYEFVFEFLHEPHYLWISALDFFSKIVDFSQRCCIFLWILGHMYFHFLKKLFLETSTFSLFFSNEGKFNFIYIWQVIFQFFFSLRKLNSGFKFFNFWGTFYPLIFHFHQFCNNECIRKIGSLLCKEEN